jgi:hypothetical protein
MILMSSFDEKEYITCGVSNLMGSFASSIIDSLIVFPTVSIFSSFISSFSTVSSVIIFIGFSFSSSLFWIAQVWELE